MAPYNNPESSYGYQPTPPASGYYKDYSQTAVPGPPQSDTNRQMTLPSQPDQARLTPYERVYGQSRPDANQPVYGNPVAAETPAPGYPASWGTAAPAASSQPATQSPSFPAETARYGASPTAASQYPQNLYGGQGQQANAYPPTSQPAAPGNPSPSPYPGTATQTSPAYPGTQSPAPSYGQAHPSAYPEVAQRPASQPYTGTPSQTYPSYNPGYPTTPPAGQTSLPYRTTEPTTQW
jgi:hypothetical protein